MLGSGFISISNHWIDTYNLEMWPKVKAFQVHSSLPLGKFKYMGVYLGWFYRQNIRKYVNVLPAYLRQFAFLVSK